MNKIISIFGPRILGGLASMLTGWIFVKTKGMVTVDPAQVVEIGGTMLTTYAATHRLLSSVINPGDSAKSRLIVAEKVAVDTGTVVKPAPPTT